MTVTIRKGERGFHLECELLLPRSIDEVFGFIPLSRNLGPGETARVRATIPVPTGSGSYELEILNLQSLDARRGLIGGGVLRIPFVVE